MGGISRSSGGWWNDCKSNAEMCTNLRDTHLEDMRPYD